jgi:hypothetical protein
MKANKGKEDSINDLLGSIKLPDDSFQDATVTKTIAKEEQRESKTKGFVRIEPCYSELFKGNSMFAGTKLLLKILKERNGNYRLPVKSAKEFSERYPSISNRFITTVGNGLAFKEDAIRDFTINIPANGLNLDLNDDMDKFLYDVLQTFPEIGREKYPANVYQKFYIVDTVKEASEELSKARTEHYALSRLYSMTTEDKIWFNSFLGKPTYNVSIDILEYNIVQEIKKNPEAFVAVLEDKERLQSIAEVNRLLEYKIIVRNGTSYMYNDVVLGTSIDDVAKYLLEKRNTTLRLQLLDRLPE